MLFPMFSVFRNLLYADPYIDLFTFCFLFIQGGSLYNYMYHFGYIFTVYQFLAVQFSIFTSKQMYYSNTQTYQTFTIRQRIDSVSGIQNTEALGRKATN